MSTDNAISDRAAPVAFAGGERQNSKKRLRTESAFTLVEVLAAVGVVAILAALLVPTAAAVRETAQRFETKARFQQWALAMEEFRTEYGYYPDVSTDGLIDPLKFLGALTARDHTGSALAGNALCGNVRKLRFYTAGGKELQRDAAGLPLPEILDGFENSQIVALADRDGDGSIRGLELVRKSLAAGNARDGFSPIVAAPEQELAEGSVIHARIAFYSVGAGERSDRFILSWK